MTLQVSIYTLCALFCFFRELVRSIVNTNRKDLTRTAKPVPVPAGVLSGRVRSSSVRPSAAPSGRDARPDPRRRRRRTHCNRSGRRCLSIPSLVSGDCCKMGSCACCSLLRRDNIFAAMNVACSPEFPVEAGALRDKGGFRRHGTCSVAAPLYVDGSPQALPLPSQARLHENRGAERKNADQAGPISALCDSEARCLPAPL